MPSDDPLSKGPPAPLLADPFDPKLARLAKAVLIALGAEIVILYLLGRALS